MFDVPDTDKLVTPDIAPSKSKLPVTVKAFDPPVTAASVTVEPCSVLSPPESVVVPEYDCVPVVVTFAPILDVPDTDKLVTPDIAPSKSKLPVTVKAFDPPVTAASVTVEPCSVLSPPESVVVPEYDCVPVVVTFAPILDVPDTDTDKLLLLI